MLQCYSWERNKEEKALLRSDLRRWTSLTIHGTHFWYTLKLSNIISSFSASGMSTVASWSSASSLNIFCKENFTTSQLQNSGYYKICFYYKLKFASCNFYPLVCVLELHTQKTIVSASWLPFNYLKHVFPEPFQESKYTCTPSLSSEILRFAYILSDSILDMFLFVLPQYATSCQR